MKRDLGHGPRLTDEEYDREVVNLRKSLPASPSREQDRASRRQELDLAIDHRLGRDFPQFRRDALWQIAEHIEQRRLRLAFLYFLRRCFSRWFDRKAEGQAGLLIREYAKVLTKDELASFFDLSEDEQALLAGNATKAKKGDRS